jgi:ribosomal protein L11 methyltransferase
MKKVSGKTNKKKQWFAVSLLVPKGNKEGVSNFLIEQGALGIEERDDESGHERLMAYFVKDQKEKQVSMRVQKYLQSLDDIFPGIFRQQIETIPIPEQDWGENWKQSFKPVHVTPKVIVKPPWSKVKSRKDQMVIDINPAMAFGTGTHATTKLCIRALERNIRKKGISVLDVGTGSGILAILAGRLGAGEAWGIDVDGVAVENAEENVDLNRVSDAVKIKESGIGSIRKKFDLVVANIDFKGLKKIRMPLVHRLDEHGILILSGILATEKEKICRYYLESGLLRLVKAAREEEWVCLIFIRK